MRGSTPERPQSRRDGRRLAERQCHNQFGIFLIKIRHAGSISLATSRVCCQANDLTVRRVRIADRLRVVGTALSTTGAVDASGGLVADPGRLVRYDATRSAIIVAYEVNDPS